MEQFEKVFKEVESKYQRGEKALKADYESLQKVKKTLVDEKKHIRFGDWNAFDIEVLNKNCVSRLKKIAFFMHKSTNNFNSWKIKT